MVATTEKSKIYIRAVKGLEKTAIRGDLGGNIDVCVNVDVEFVLNVVNALKTALPIWYKKYYNHHFVAVLNDAQKSFVAFHVVLSYKEHNVSRKELEEYLARASEVASKQLKRLYERGYRCDGLLVFIVGNFAQRYCGTLKEYDLPFAYKVNSKLFVYKRDVRYDVGIKRHEWFLTFAERIKAWLQKRIEKLKKYHELHDRNSVDDTLYNWLLDLFKAFSVLEKNFVEFYKKIENVDPLQRDVVVTAASLGRSIGAPTDVNSVVALSRMVAAPVAKALEEKNEREKLKKLRFEDPWVVENVLKSTSVSTKRGYSPLKYFEHRATSNLKAITDGAKYKEGKLKIRILTKEFLEQELKRLSLEDATDALLPVYIAHWFTSRGLKLTWRTLEAITYHLLYVLYSNDDSRYDHACEVVSKVIGALKEHNEENPCFLIQFSAIPFVQKALYGKFYLKAKVRKR